MTEPEIVDLQPRLTAAIRVIQPMAELDLSSAFDHGIPLVAERVVAAGGSLAGPPFGRYHVFGPHVVDVEIGFPVDVVPDLPRLKDCAPGDVGRSQLPGGPVAKTTHLGSYDGLSATYDALHEWIHAQPGYDDSVGAWESYIDDPTAADDPATVRTEIYWPLERE